MVPGISVSTVTRWLAQEKIRPWRYHNWQSILDLEQFLQRARPVLQLYQRAAELLTQGTWTICVDEKTSIQARRREAATQPAQPGRPVRQVLALAGKALCNFLPPSAWRTVKSSGAASPDGAL